MKKLKKIVKNVDYFGTPIQFNIDGKDTYKSSIGGISTIIMVALVILFFSTQINNFFQKKNLNSEVYNKFSFYPNKIQLDFSNFLFAISIDQLPEYSFATSPFFELTLTQLTKNLTSNNKTSNQIPLVPCTAEFLSQFKNFGNQINNTYKRVQFFLKIYIQSLIIQTFCVQKKTFNFFWKVLIQMIFSHTSNQIFKNVQTEVILKQSLFLLSFQICAPSEIIANYVQSNDIQISIYTSNYVINYDQIGEYSQLYLAEDLHFKFSPLKYKKQANVFFKKFEVQIDESLFIDNDYRNEEFIYREINSVKEEIITDNNQPYFSLFFRSDNFSQQAKRKYMKIDQLLSFLGGIFQIFVLVFGLIIYNYNKKYLTLKLANKLYEFKEAKKRSVNQSKNKKVQQLDNILNQNIARKSLEDKQIIIQVNDDSEKEQLMTLQDVINLDKVSELGFSSRKEFLLFYFKNLFFNTNKLKPTLSYIIYILTCKKKQQNDYNRELEKATVIIQRDLNIKQILQKQLQIGKLKKLLLNQDQQVLFNFIPKPMISSNQYSMTDTVAFNDLENQEQSQNFNEDSSKQYKQFLLLLDAYDQILKNYSSDDSHSMTNRKLIYLLGSEMRNLFKVSLLISGKDKNEVINLFKKNQENSNQLEKLMKDEEKELVQIRAALFAQISKEEVEKRKKIINEKEE